MFNYYNSKFTKFNKNWEDHLKELIKDLFLSLSKINCNNSLKFCPLKVDCDASRQSLCLSEVYENKIITQHIIIIHT